MFVGRQYELEQLNSAYNSGSFECVAIYGRRHIGKTSLISEFIKGKNAIYFSARELTDKYNLEAFAQKVADYFGISAGGMTTWATALETLYTLMDGERLILVLDNYAGAYMTNKELSAAISEAIEHSFKHSKLFLILCCNQMSAFEREVLGKNSILRKHLTLALQIKGLSFDDACAFMEGFNEAEKKELYSCVGGTPLYLSMIRSSEAVEENITRLFFRSDGFINNDISMALQKELMGPAVYNSLLRAVAYGNHRSKEILEETGEDKSKAHKYMNVLISMGILDRSVPEGEDPLVSRKGTYHFEDNAYRFWYRYVFDNRDLIARGISVVR